MQTAMLQMLINVPNVPALYTSMVINADLAQLVDSKEIIMNVKHAKQVANLV